MKRYSFAISFLTTIAVLCCSAAILFCIVIGCTNEYPAGKFRTPADLPLDSNPTTNVYTATVVKVGKVKISCNPAGTIWSDGTANWKNATNGQWFFYTSGNNWFQLHFSNNIPIIQWQDIDGNNGCGFGTVTVTDTVFPGTPIHFTLRWPTNLVFPTNPIPMTVVNLTNHL